MKRPRAHSTNSCRDDLVYVTSYQLSGCFSGKSPHFDSSVNFKITLSTQHKIANINTLFCLSPHYTYSRLSLSCFFISVPLSFPHSTLLLACTDIFLTCSFKTVVPFKYKFSSTFHAAQLAISCLCSLFSCICPSHY